MSLIKATAEECPPPPLSPMLMTYLNYTNYNLFFASFAVCIDLSMSMATSNSSSCPKLKLKHSTERCQWQVKGQQQGLEQEQGQQQGLEQELGQAEAACNLKSLFWLQTNNDNGNFAIVSNGESHLLCRLSACRLQHAAANEATRQRQRLATSCKVISCVCASEIERTCTLQKKLRGNRAKLVELAKLLAGGKAKNRRVVRCRQEKKGGKREEKGGGIRFAWFAWAEPLITRSLQSKAVKR